MIIKNATKKIRRIIRLLDWLNTGIVQTRGMKYEER
jgi:hypothetical protein